MAKYKIVKGNNPKVTSNNSRELKRRIKNPQYREYTDGVYNFCNKAGKVCFKVEYTTTVVDKNNTTLKGKQFNIQ